MSAKTDKAHKIGKKLANRYGRDSGEYCRLYHTGCLMVLTDATFWEWKFIIGLLKAKQQ